MTKTMLPVECRPYLSPASDGYFHNGTGRGRGGGAIICPHHVSGTSGPICKLERRSVDIEKNYLSQRNVVDSEGTDDVTGQVSQNV